MTRRVIETVTRVAEPHTDCRTAEQMTDICCEQAEAVPCCELVESWTGYSDEDFLDSLGLVLDAQGRDAQGRYVEIRRLPRSQPCGEQKTIYDVTPNACCAFAVPLVYEEDESGEVVADNSYAIVVFSGGKSPVNITVYGSGFYVDAARTMKSAWFTSGTVKIYTADACGPCQIVATDGCSVAEGWLRSTSGLWVAKFNNSGGVYDDNGAELYPGGCPAMFPGGVSSLYTMTDDYGKWQVRQLYADGYWSDYDYAMPWDEAMAWCETQKAIPRPLGITTGGCFYDKPGWCMTCGDCVFGTSNQQRSGDIGYHASFWPDEDEQYAPSSQWVIVTHTIIWEWEC